MKEKLHEQLSALVDDELDTNEQSLLVRRLITDDSLRRRFARYQIISDTLKGDLPERVDPGLHLRIQAALQNEAVPGVSRLHKLMKPAAGVAIAASVAVVAVLSLQSVRDSVPVSVPTVASAPAPSDYIRAEGQPLPVRQASRVRNLDAYLVNHNEFAVNRGIQGVLPYVRIVGQGEQPGSQEDAE